MITNIKKITLAAAAVTLSAIPFTSTADTSAMGSMSHSGGAMTDKDTAHKFFYEDKSNFLFVHTGKMKTYGLGLQHGLGRGAVGKMSDAKFMSHLFSGKAMVKTFSFGALNTKTMTAA